MVYLLGIGRVVKDDQDPPASQAGSIQPSPILDPARIQKGAALYPQRPQEFRKNIAGRSRVLVKAAQIRI
jgi:hypothetical protein